MHLLVLGGTVFLGKHVVSEALARGHDVTLFNRGRHNPELFPQAEKLRGDRDGDLAALHDRSWDAVVDTCGYVPRIVRASAEMLEDATEHYTFVSSVSVYADLSQRGLDESAPVGRLGDPSIEEITGETYGPLKALCEEAAEGAMPGRVFNVRPGLIVGPDDPTDRFTYWPRRVQRGGRVLAPGNPDQPVQVIDVRDLASWIVRAAEQRIVGVYNATGPDGVLGMRAFLDACVHEAGERAKTAEIVWVDETYLIEQGVTPFSDLPVWVPADSPGVFTVDVRRALANGLALRPIRDTIADTLAWDATLPEDRELRAGLTAERERELLEAYDG
jgi:2'-hydroxyisoflavone reductase